MKKKLKKITQLDIPKKSVFIYILLVLLPLLLYWKTINYDYTTLDDSQIIKENISFISNFNNLFKAFEKDNFISKSGRNYYRPIQTVSLMIDAQICGKSLWAFHMSNLIYHILTVIMLFLLLKEIGISENISSAISLLFSIHPFFTNAIIWIPGRGDLLAGLFGTASFLSFLKFISTRRRIYIWAHLGAMVIAIFSKEIAIGLPLVIIFYYWFVLNNQHKVRELIPLIPFWSLFIVAFIFFRNKFLAPVNMNYFGFDSFLSNLPIIPISISKIIIPLGLSPMPIFDKLYTIVGLIFLIVLVVYVLFVDAKNESSILAGIIWFLVFLIPPMFIKLTYSEYFFQYLECRMYLPSVGLFITLAIITNGFFKKYKINERTKFFMPVILLFSILTYIYSGVYCDSITLLSTVIKSNPNNAGALILRGLVSYKLGDLEKAKNDMKRSLEICPTYPDANYNLGVVYADLKESERAKECFIKTIKTDSLHTVLAYINLSNIEYDRKNYHEVLRLLNSALNYDSTRDIIYYNRGNAYCALGEYKKGINDYTKAISLSPGILDYYNNIAIAEINVGNYDSALTFCGKVLALNPEFSQAFVNIGVVYLKTGRFKESIIEFSNAIKMNPQYFEAYHYRSIVLEKIGSLDAAEKDNTVWQKSQSQVINRNL